MASPPLTLPLPHVNLFDILISPHNKLTELKAQIRAAAAAEEASPLPEAMPTKPNPKIMVADKSKAHASLGLIFQDMPPRMYKVSSSSLRRKKDAHVTPAALPTLAIVSDATDGTAKDKVTTTKDAGLTDSNGEARAVDPDAFTAEQDALLLKLKSEGTTWANIGAEIGKTKGQVQGRFKELTKAGDAAAKSNGAQGKAQEGAVGRGDDQKADTNAANERTQHEKDDKMQSGLGKKGKKDKGAKQKKQAETTAVEQPPFNEQKVTLAVKGDDKGHTAANEGRKVSRLKADSLFSIEDLRILAEEKLKDDDECWLRLASRLYDRTGKRIHPDQVKSKFERH